MIPFWGSGKQAIHDFECGDWGWGLVNTAMTVSDVFLVKSAVTGLVKGGVKLTGNFSWSAMRKYFGQTGFAEAGQHLHHWIIPKNGWGKGIPGYIKNQMPNLIPMKSPQLHMALHNGKLNAFERFWHGTPVWAKAGAISAGGKVTNFIRGGSGCGCN